MVGRELYAFHNATNRKFQRQIVGFVTRHCNGAEEFMVACAVQHSIRLIARLAEIVKTDFIRILLVGRGRGDEYPLVYC